MFRKNDLKRNLNVDAAISQKMTQAIEMWRQMYNGDAPWLCDRVKSLNLPSAIASELARLVTIELKSQVSGSARAEYLNLPYLTVVDKLRQYVEYGCALGGLILKPYVSGDKICVDYIQADSFVPTAFDNSGRITGAVFIDQIKREDKIFTRLEYHNLQDGFYRIRNLAFCSYNPADLGQPKSLAEVLEWAELEPEVVLANVSVPLFAYFKVPQANTIDTKSPLGVSVFSRAVDLIEEADKQYSRLLWEFESGERALFVSDTAFKKDSQGKPMLPNKRLYKTIDGAEDLFEDWTPTLREQNIINGLDNILIKIEDTCGLARGTFSNPQSEAKTATELKILRQRSYATVADTQKALQKAMLDLVDAMDVWCSVYELTPGGKYEVSFEFDDSIVTDRAAEFAEKQQLVADGIMQPWEFRMWYFGETEAQAKVMLKDGEEDKAGQSAPAKAWSMPGL